MDKSTGYSEQDLMRNNEFNGLMNTKRKSILERAMDGKKAEKKKKGIKF
jgi:hypothetical protein